VLKNVLATSAVAMPQVAGESQFEQLVGTAVKNLFADAVSGPVSAQMVKRSASVPKPARSIALETQPCAAFDV